MEDTTTTHPTVFGDALRRLADRVDAVPALLGAATYPRAPHVLVIPVRTADAVRVLARDFDATPVEFQHDGHVHTSFEVECFPVALRVAHMGPTSRDPLLRQVPGLAAPPHEVRELHRPADVTERIEADL